MSKLCSVCGNEIPDEEATVIDGQVLCHEHFEELYVSCDCCGQLIRRDQTRTATDGKIVCEDCIGNEYDVCAECGDLVPSFRLNVVNEDCYDEIIVCNHCLNTSDSLFTCDCCGNTYTDNHLAHGDGFSAICEGCIDNYSHCAACGDLVHEDNLYYCDEDEEYYCESCYHEARRRQRRGINSYGFKPLPIFGTTDSHDGTDRYTGTELTFGVELECDKGSNPSVTAYEITDLTDRVYCKHDGSLDNGYEVVTHPGTLAWHMNVFPWADIIRISRDHNFTSHDARTCGLHIHIGREQLGTDDAMRRRTIANMILLTSVMWPEVCQFSRRNGDMHWCHMNEGIFALRLGMDEQRAANTVCDKSYWQDRYVAVNVQNSNTIELRFNRGTLKLSTIYACLQLASNLTLFAKEHTMNECLDAKWDDVVHFREYDELTSYVNSRFAGWTANESERPTTRFRVGLEPEVEVVHTDKSTRASLVTEGAELMPEGTWARLGDLVILTERYQSGSPRVGSIGLCIETNGDIYDTGFVWSDPNHTGHRHISARFRDSQWYVPADHYRVIRRFRNGQTPDREANLRMLSESSVMPGDMVTTGDPNEFGTLLYSFDLGGVNVIAGLVQLDDGSPNRIVNHNGDGMTTDNSCRYIMPSYLHRV